MSFVIHCVHNILQYVVLGGRPKEVDVGNMTYRGSEVLICASLYGHAFKTLRVWQNDCDVCISGVQQKGFDFAIFSGCD